MAKAFFARFLQALLVLFCLYTITFWLARTLPGSPFTNEKALPERTLAQLNANYGFDKPLIVQYLLGVGQKLTGKFGFSTIFENREVSDILKQSFPVSALLGLLSLGISLAIGIPGGIIAAARRNRAADYWVMGLATFGICLPAFVIGPLLALLFGIKLQWLPATGWSSGLSFVLPALTLSLANAAYISRLTRAGMLEVLTSDWIRTAKAKGLSGPVILVKHALRGALVPVVAYLGPATAAVVSGSVVIETVFNLPGLGNIFIQAIHKRDSFLIEGSVIFYGLLVIIGVVVSDLLQVWLNPRLRKS